MEEDLELTLQAKKLAFLAMVEEQELTFPVVEEVWELTQFKLESHQAKEVELMPTFPVEELLQVQSFLVKQVLEGRSY